MTCRDAAIVDRTRDARCRQAGSVSNRPVGADVARSRAGMAELVTQAVATTRKLERRLDATGGWPEASARIDFDADPAAAVRLMGALLLRKARIHTDAVLRANETNNLHSLAVQDETGPRMCWASRVHLPDHHHCARLSDVTGECPCSVRGPFERGLLSNVSQNNERRDQPRGAARNGDGSASP